MKSHNKTSILSAIGGNCIVMVAKLIGFLFTGSSAMLAETIHSFADILNQSFLLVGIIRAEQKPDKEHNTGYGRAQFVWAIISAVGIFFLGCGVTMYHGIHQLLHPTPFHEYRIWPIAVLAFSLLVEGTVLFIAWKELRQSAQGKPFWNYLREEADPSTVAVFMEDSGACIGVMIAFISIGLTSYTHQTYWDAIGSIIIGILLGGIAIWLIQRNKDLLLGRSIPSADLEILHKILRQKHYLGNIDHIRTEIIGSSDYDIQLEIEFNEHKLLQTLPINLQEEYNNIHCYKDFCAASQKISLLSINHLIETIDSLEEEIKTNIPNIRFIDIEPN